VGWELKYSYTFSWLGRPIIQLPEDMIRLQEAIYRLQPDVILETGCAWQFPIFSASPVNCWGGRVIMDIEIRPANRPPSKPSVGSTDHLIRAGSLLQVVRQVKAMIRPGRWCHVWFQSLPSMLAELKRITIWFLAGSYHRDRRIMRDLYDAAGSATVLG
jgi:cephalosporin hydroxylase